MVFVPEIFRYFLGNFPTLQITIKELGYIPLFVITISVPPGKRLRRGAKKRSISMCQSPRAKLSLEK